MLLVGLLPTSASAQTKLDNPVLTLEPTASGELTAIWNDVSGADSYNLLYRTKGTETWFVSNANVNRIFPATSPQVITGLTNGTTYEVRVIANPGPGISPSLSGASGTVEGTPNPPPTSISDLQLTPKDGSIEVSWTAATVAPNGYSVRWRKRSPAPAEPNLTPIKEVGGTSFTIPDLTNGSLYLVVVHTLNRADDGIERSTRVDGTARPRANTAPTVANAIPDQTATAASDFSYAFPPNTFSDADGHPLTYTASRADDMALPTWLTFTASERTFSGIPGATEIGTTISVKVTASDTEGGSVSDEFDITVTKGTLATPTGLAVKSDTLSQVGFTVTWTAVPNAAGYTATATPSGGSAIDGTVFTTGTKPQASFTGLSASTAYTVSVTATGNANYNNSEPETLRVTTSAAVPTQASDLQVAAADRSLNVSWTAATTAPNGYSVRWRPTGPGTTLTDANTVFGTSFIIPDLTPGTAYLVRLETRNFANDGLEADTAVTTPAGITPFGATYMAPTTLSVGTDVTVTPVSGGFGNDTPSYAVTTGTLPAGLELDAATGVISGTPTTVSSSTTTVTITVTAGSGSTQKISTPDIIFPAVVAANAIPEITDITDKDATFGTDLMVDVDATDTDAGDTLQYSASSSDVAVATVIPTTLTNLDANSQVTVTPVGEGTATITVTVSDGTAMPTDTFVVTVSRAQLDTPVVTLTVGDGQLTPIWAEVADASSYDLQWKRSSVTSWTATEVTTVASTTSGTAITGLTNGEAHDVRVRAKAAAGSTTYADSDWSSGTQGTPNRTLSMRLRDKAGTNVIFDDGDQPTLDAAWEDVGTVEFDVTLSSAISAGDAAVTVDYATSDIPRTDPPIDLVQEIYPAVADQDYTAASGTLTFAAGETTKTITVRIPDDTTYEQREKVFRIELSNPVGTNIAPSQGTLDLAIVNDDPFPPVTIEATGLTSTGSPGATATDAEGRLRVVEGDSGLTSVTFTVSQPIVVDWRNIPAGDLIPKTGLGTATADTDFPNIRAESFLFGDRTERNFTVSITGDTEAEDDETFYIEFSRARPDSIVSNTGDNMFLIEITIVDDDGVPSAPSAPSLTMTASGQLTANWMAPMDDGGSGITDYDVRYRVKPTSGDPAWTLLDDTGMNAADMKTTTTIGGLINGTMYQVQVRAQNGNGEGAWSTSAEGTPSASNLVPSFGTMTIDDQIWVVDTNMSLTLPAATGGDGRLSYTLSPALPAGITFDEPTRTLSGTPTAVASAVTYTLTVADGDSDTASLTFSLAVGNGRLATPTGLVLKPDTISPNQFKVTWNAVANATDYTATAVQSSRSVIGSVTMPSSGPEATFIGLDSNATYTVTVVAKGNANYQDSMGATLTVTTPSFTSDVAPNFGIETIEDQIWVVGTPVNLTLPTATGGNQGLSYTLSPNTLPAGVTFDATTRRLSGIPTAMASAATYTWTAADGDSNTAASDTTSLTFQVTVNKGTLATPTGLALKANTQTQTGFTVSWTAVTNATGYMATATPSDGTAVTGMVIGTEATFTGLEVNTTYTVSVVATDNTDNYNDSAAATLSQATAAMVTKEKLDEVNEEVAPSIINEVAARQTAIITNRFEIISSGLNRGDLSMEKVATDVADYLFSHHQEIQANGLDWRQALSGNNFSFALADTSVSQGSIGDQELSSFGPTSFWGGIDYSSLEDKIKDFTLDGDITSFNFGVDKEFTSDLVLGILLSIANSEFELTEGSTDSTYEVDIFTLNPYISWQESENSSLWASVGYGRGQVDLTDDSTNPPVSERGNFTRFSAGGRFQLWQSEAGTALALKLDGTTAHFLGADVQRSRLATELSHDFSIESGVLNTALELGLLMSSADESAAELVGGLHWQGDAGLSGSIRSRVLLGGGDRQEWGIGGALRYTAAGGEGLMMALEPSFGISNPQLLPDLWQVTTSNPATTTVAPTAQLNAKLAYGFPTTGGLFTPYTDFSFSETTSTYGAGLRYGLSTGLDLDLKGTHKNTTMDDAENSILLELRSDL